MRSIIYRLSKDFVGVRESERNGKMTKCNVKEGGDRKDEEW